MHSQPPNQVEARKRVCEEAGPSKAEDSDNRQKRVKARQLWFSGGLWKLRALVNVHLFLEFAINGDDPRVFIEVKKDGNVDSIIQISG